jgi:hypothetical protein
MATKKTLVIENCQDCPHHENRMDPDPDDWFCDDDMKVVCLKTSRKDNEITCACRPYNLRKESEVPKWCPL